MPEPLTIAVDSTPNPHAMKFTLNRIVATKGETYRLPAAPDGSAQAGDVATASPWAKALLAIPGVLSVYGVNAFISVNKRPDVEWAAIVPQAEAALRQVFV